MKKIRRLCVYCGSSGAVELQFREAASELGRLLGEAGIELVYGGGRVGLMGLLADAALNAGGKVTGVIPSRLLRAEVAHPGVTELVAVDIGGYWAPLRELLDHIVVSGFAREQTRGLLRVVASVSALMTALSAESVGLQKTDVDQL